MQKSLCLCMIVKNESMIIERCLQSVMNYINYWIIVDTGSTDNTCDIINKKLKDINGELHHREWVNFGHNRNEAIQIAKGKCDYILLMDADMELVVCEQFFMNKLEKNTYEVKQKCRYTEYYNKRIINGKIDYKYIGVTHEYIICLQDNSVEKNNDIYFIDYEDGRNRDEKYQRDIKLLEDGLITEPLNYRYMFYLANSYREIKKYDLAIAYYGMHQLNCTFCEEKWMSVYYMGLCYKLSKKMKEFVYHMLEAIDMREWRIEPYYELAKYYRENCKYKLAYTFAAWGKKKYDPKHEIMFLDKSIADFYIPFELSISCYYNNAIDLGLANAKIVLNSYVNDEYCKELTKLNLGFYE